jgi:hypothetical protein
MIALELLNASLTLFKIVTSSLEPGCTGIPFDVITAMTFSERLGFLDRGEDVQGIISAIEGRLLYNSIIG